MSTILMKEIQRDPSLANCTLDTMPLVQILLDEHAFDRQHRREVCIERAHYLTEYMRDLRPDGEDGQVSRAKAVAHYLAQRDPVFPHEGNLLAGSTTSKGLGAPLYPEFLGLSIWPELDTIGSRASNPQLLHESEARECNREIFPFWMNKTPIEIVRKRYDNPPSLRLMEKIVYFISGKAGCISHCIPSYERALREGLLSIIEEAAAKERELRRDLGGGGDRSIHFYSAVQIALRGILAYTGRLATEARRLAEREWVRERRENYLAMAEVCDRVPAYPARTFREAVNALWLCHVGILAENTNMGVSPGRLDQVLYPHFRTDVTRNRLSLEEALDLTCCLWLKIADNVCLVPEASEKYWGGAGSVPAVTLGGVDRDGEDAVNDLTYIFLRTTELLKLRDPNVNARYHHMVHDRVYRDRVSEVILNTRAIPAFHNDMTDIEALRSQGLSLEDARDYGIVGCVELAGCGTDYVASASIILNLCADTLPRPFRGREHGDEYPGLDTARERSPDFPTFAAFAGAVRERLKWLIGQAIDLNEKLGAVHQEVLPTPLLSAFFVGPLAKGKDLIDGGARYNSSGATHVGFADLCDSLNAVQDAVFVKRKYTLEELAAAVHNDFKEDDGPRVLAYLRNTAPKYGSNAQTARANADALLSFLFQLYQRHTNYRGGKYRPAYWTTTFHAGLGTLSPALPSGRRAGQPFSSGITPVSQTGLGLLEVYDAVASLDSGQIPGGEALNMKYTPAEGLLSRPDRIARFGDYVDGYFRKGGMQVQFNILSYEDLLDAKENPERYQDLIVRVSGYSAYFNDLNEYMKDELIRRTQHEMHCGTAVPLPPQIGGTR